MGSGGDNLNDVTPEEWDALKQDMVNHPAHYTQHKWEVIEVLEEFFSDDPLLWQVGKYILRAKYKGQEKQDLEKAVFYLQRKIGKLK